MTAASRAALLLRLVARMLLIGVLAALAPTAVALDRDRTLAQFHHTAWTVSDGAPADIWALEQTRDGYLWLGTGTGLYRFDGVEFERFHPAAGEQFRSNNITALTATLRVTARRNRSGFFLIATAACGPRMPCGAVSFACLFPNGPISSRPCGTTR